MATKLTKDVFWETDEQGRIVGYQIGTQKGDMASLNATLWKTQMSAAYRAGLSSGNPRTRAKLPVAATAFGGAPAAGTVGYSNADSGTPPNVAGKRFFDLTAAPYLGTQGWGPFRVEGSNAYDAGLPRQGVSYYSGGVTRVAGTWRARFITDDPEPVLYTTGYGTSLPLVIDGQRTAANVVAMAGGGRTGVSINLRGLGAGYHSIDVLLALDTVLAGIYIDPRYQIITPPARPVIVMFTDSLGNTSPDAVSYDCYPQFIADWLGADVRCFAAGGSGYVAPGAFEPFAARVPLAQAMLAAAGVPAPAVCIFAGGVNDANTGAIPGAVAAAITAAQAAWPSARQVVMGSWASNNAGSQANQLTLERVIHTAAAAAGAITIPVMSDPSGAWITGSGNTAAPTGTGTADILFGNADGTHWIAAGHAAMGHKSAHALASALGL